MPSAPASRKSFIRRLGHLVVRALRSVVLLEDTPYRIAMGSACGIFCAVLPVVGQTFVAMLCAWLMRANVIASIPWSWITNPVTTLPVWYGCYRLGILLTGGDALTYDALAAIMKSILESGLLHFFAEAGRLFLSVFLPTLVGSVTVGAICAVPGFFAVRAGVRVMHARRAARAAAWRERLNQAEARPLDTP
jgi:uncharacterized protein